MLRSPKVLRVSLHVLVLAAGLLSAAVAQGVTPAHVIKDAERVDAVTTSAAIRAQADVQIRRIKSLIITKATRDDDATFDRLEKLQKQLRGEK